MRIAHITTIDRSLHSLLFNQLRSLQGAGYEVVGISSPGPVVPVLKAAGIEHVPVRMTRRISPLADLAALAQLVQVLRHGRFNIVHTHTPKPGLLGQLAARMAGVPLVVNTVHGFYFHEHMHPAQRRFYIALERVAARCSDVILFQNREDLALALRERIASPGQAIYLGNGIDLALFDPARFSAADALEARRELGLEDASGVVGFVGRLAGRRKGFTDFLAAAQRVLAERPQTRFLIVGDADRGKPDALGPAAATELGLGAACRFLGRQPNEELPRLYRAMDLLVLPSLFEGLPRAVMEASAMQVPAVVSDVKGNREAVEQGRNGLRVPLGDVEALAGAIVELLVDRERAQRMGREGRRIALERFDERQVFARVQAQYARLLEAKGWSVSRDEERE